MYIYSIYRHIVIWRMMVVDGPSLKGESMVLLVSKKKTTIQKFQPASRSF